MVSNNQCDNSKPTLKTEEATVFFLLKLINGNQNFFKSYFVIEIDYVKYNLF